MNAQVPAGLVETRRSRQTGHMVSIYDGGPAGMDTEAGRWQTVCEPHGHIISHGTLKLARHWLADPLGWCEECMAERSPEKLDTPEEYDLAEVLGALDLARHTMSYQEQASFVFMRFGVQRCNGLDQALAALDACKAWSRLSYQEMAVLVLHKVAGVLSG